MSWPGVQSVLSKLCHVKLLAFKFCLPKKKNRANRGSIIWLATVWQIWLAKNKLLFRREPPGADFVVEIKRRSLQWFKCFAGNSAAGVSYSSCCLDPLACILQRG